MLDLKPFEDAIEQLNSGEFNNLGELNLAAWLGERAHYLVDEIKQLRDHQIDPKTDGLSCPNYHKFLLKQGYNYCSYCKSKIHGC